MVRSCMQCPPTGLLVVHHHSSTSGARIGSRCRTPPDAPLGWIPAHSAGAASSFPTPRKTRSGRDIFREPARTPTCRNSSSPLRSPAGSPEQGCRHTASSGSRWSADRISPRPRWAARTAAACRSVAFPTLFAKLRLNRALSVQIAASAVHAPIRPNGGKPVGARPAPPAPAARRRAPAAPGHRARPSFPCRADPEPPECCGPAVAPPHPRPAARSGIAPRDLGHSYCDHPSPPAGLARPPRETMTSASGRQWHQD